MPRLLLVAAIFNALWGLPSLSSAQSISLPDGVWVGSMEVESMGGGDLPAINPLKVELYSCSGQARLWTQQTESLYGTTAQTYKIESRLGSHLLWFSSQEEGPKPDWVEVQSILLVEMPGDAMSLFLSRSVSNVNEPPDSKYRAFFQRGIGKLTQVSKECLRSKVQPPAATSAA